MRDVWKDKYELPPESIREAIINAVCNRCYLDHSCVQIAVYDNRVEITCPGMLKSFFAFEHTLLCFIWHSNLTLIYPNLAIIYHTPYNVMRVPAISHQKK